MFAFLALAGPPLLAQAPAAVKTRALAEIAEAPQGQASAEVKTPNDSLLAAELTAVVALVRADVGAQVRRGETLVELDASDARLALAQAEAMVAAAEASATLAQQRFERAQQLKARDFASDDDLLARSTELAAAKAEVAVRQAARRIAVRGVEKTRVVAPFDGVVLERHAQVGALAVPGTPLLRLADLAAPEVEAALQVADATRFEAASDLRFESLGRSWPLQLQRLSPVADAASRTRRVRLSFVGVPAPAGLAGVLRWSGTQRTLPADLLVRREAGLGLFIIEAGTARFVPVAEAQEGRRFAVDLPESARIVVEGHQSLRDGQAVAAD